MIYKERISKESFAALLAGLEFMRDNPPNDKAIQSYNLDIIVEAISSYSFLYDDDPEIVNVRIADQFYPKYCYLDEYFWSNIDDFKGKLDVDKWVAYFDNKLEERRAERLRKINECEKRIMKYVIECMKSKTKIVKCSVEGDGISRDFAYEVWRELESRGEIPNVIDFNQSLKQI